MTTERAPTNPFPHFDAYNAGKVCTTPEAMAAKAQDFMRTAPPWFRFETGFRFLHEDDQAVMLGFGGYDIYRKIPDLCGPCEASIPSIAGQLEYAEPGILYSCMYKGSWFIGDMLKFDGDVWGEHGFKPMLNPGGGWVRVIGRRYAARNWHAMMPVHYGHGRYQSLCCLYEANENHLLANMHANAQHEDVTCRGCLDLLWCMSFPPRDHYNGVSYVPSHNRTWHATTLRGAGSITECGIYSSALPCGGTLKAEVPPPDGRYCNHPACRPHFDHLRKETSR
jgi:hypothetical protein